MSIHFDRTKERSKQIKRELYLINHLNGKRERNQNPRVTLQSLTTEHKNPFLRNNSTYSRIRLEPYIDYQLPMDDIVMTPETKGLRHFPSLGTLANFQLYTDHDKSRKKRTNTSQGPRREYTATKKIDDSWDKLDKLDMMTYDERANSPYELREAMYKSATENHFMSTFNKTNSKFYRSSKIPEETVTNLTKFSENKTKYNFYQPKNHMSMGVSPPKKRSSKNEIQQDIEILKSSTKYSNKNNKQILANIRVRSRKMDRMKTVKETGKDQPVITSEDEHKIKMIKAKVQISKIFYQKSMSEDEKNHHYQRLLNEYKQDRGLHDPTTCEEISAYLVTNKLFLLKNEKLMAEFGPYI